MTATVTKISRRKKGVVRRASYWQDRLDQARTPKEKYEAAQDYLKARLSRYEPGELKDAEYLRIAMALNGLAPDLGLPRIRREAS